MTNYYGEQLRRLLLTDQPIDLLVDLEPTKVFAKAVVDTSVLIFSEKQPGDLPETAVYQGTKDYKIVYKYDIAQDVWARDTEAVINLNASPSDIAILEKLASTTVLEKYIDYSQGVILYKTKADGKENRYISETSKGEAWLPLLESASQVKRYSVAEPKSFIHYGKWLWCERETRYFSQPKILFHRLRKKLPVQLVGAIDRSGVVNRHSSSNLILRLSVPDDMLDAILGLFNSTLANWWFVKRYGMLMEVGGFKIGKLPLPGTWEQSYEALVPLVQTLTESNAKLSKTRLSQDRKFVERQIKSTDRQINQLVYKLYELTPEEIALVEGGSVPRPGEGD